MNNLKIIILFIGSFYLIADIDLENIQASLIYEPISILLEKDVSKILEFDFTEIVKKLPLDKEYYIEGNKNNYIVKTKDGKLTINFLYFKDSDTALRKLSMKHTEASLFDAIFSNIFNSLNIGNYTICVNSRISFIRNNIFVHLYISSDSVSYHYSCFFDEDRQEKNLYYLNLAKKIDELICEENGIEYEKEIDISVFEEKKHFEISKTIFNKFQELEENKRKIADGTYTKIEDLPKPQSQSDNVKNNVKDPQEEKTVTKIDSPISPKIENSKSKIFIIFGILFTVVFGGFLLIYKKRKKKNKIKNNETNN